VHIFLIRKSFLLEEKVSGQEEGGGLFTGKSERGKEAVFIDIIAAMRSGGRVYW